MPPVSRHKCGICATLTAEDLTLLFKGKWYCYPCISTLALDMAHQKAEQTLAKWRRGEL